MSLPNPQRVEYDKNPIEEVICQLRFPAILRVDQGMPADFQDRIRDHYPIYTEEQPLGGLQIPEQLKQLVAGAAFQAQGARPAHRFMSEDGRWTISLTRDFMAVSTKSYIRWTDFSSHLYRAISALEHVYRPSFYSRVGLRYRNRIRRSGIDLEGVSWSELLKPHIAAVLRTDVAPQVEEVKHIILLSLETGKVRIRHGLEQDENDPEQVYVIDNDFFSEGKTETTDVQRTLQYFNEQARNAFRWCIADRLHDAMVPQPMAQAG